MSPSIFHRGRPGLPSDVLAALDRDTDGHGKGGRDKGDRVLAFAADEETGAHVVATTYALSVVREGDRRLHRRWAEVDAGTWQPDQARLTVTWTDGSRPVSWAFGEQRTLLPETVRERVQGSVVLSRQVALSDRRSAQVAVRRDYETGDLFTQVVLGRRIRRDDPEVRAVIDAVLADLRDQVGLPPTRDPW